MICRYASTSFVSSSSHSYNVSLSTLFSTHFARGPVGCALHIRSLLCLVRAPRHAPAANRADPRISISSDSPKLFLRPMIINASSTSVLVLIRGRMLEVEFSSDPTWPRSDHFAMDPDLTNHNGPRLWSSVRYSSSTSGESAHDVFSLAIH